MCLQENITPKNTAKMSNAKRFAKNVIWKFLEVISVSGIQLICTFILARFLTPSDYGIMGMVLIFSILSNTIIASGFGQALIREKEVTKIDYSTIFYTNTILSILIYILLYFGSPYIAIFYDKPILTDVCRITFLALPLNAISLVQHTILQKEVRFKKLFLISLTASLISSIVAIIIASIYKNVWALVVQNLLTYIIKALLLWITTDFIPIIRFSFDSLKKYFAFSKNILIGGIIGAIFNNIHSLIIGKAYSTAELGFYSQALRIYNLGSHTTTQVIQSVSYPILSRINNENNDIKNGYKKIIGVTLIFVGLVMALFMGCSQNLFELLMGSEEWRTAGLFFLLIGIDGILYPLHSINQNILMVKGKSDVILYLEIARRAIMIAILAITLQFNIKYFVFGQSIYSIILLFINLYFCGKPINYTLKEQIKDTMPIFARLAATIIIANIVGYLLQDVHLIIRVVAAMTTTVISSGILFWKQKDFQNMTLLLGSFIKK